ncbi:hypothetical protein ACL02T_31465 [Pseudonocardia sp. RS010]|uniref:hypothetical protein n=1 Tax=Pseudonocardia sp. RS010 TaxID=3385979 RepID=UPI0039A39A06
MQDREDRETRTGPDTATDPATDAGSGARAETARSDERVHEQRVHEERVHEERVHEERVHEQRVDELAQQLNVAHNCSPPRPGDPDY